MVVAADIVEEEVVTIVEIVEDIVVVVVMIDIGGRLHLTTGVMTIVEDQGLGLIHHVSSAM